MSRHSTKTHQFLPTALLTLFMKNNMKPSSATGHFENKLPLVP